MNKTPTSTSQCLHKNCFCSVPEITWGSHKQPHYTEGNRQTYRAHQKTTVVLRWGHTFNCKHPYRMQFAVSFLNYSKAFLTKSSSGGRRIAMACYDIAPSSFYLTLPLRSSLLLNLKSKPLCCPSASRNHLYQIELSSSPSTRLACPPHA